MTYNIKDAREIILPELTNKYQSLNTIVFKIQENNSKIHYNSVKKMIYLLLNEGLVEQLVISKLQIFWRLKDE